MNSQEINKLYDDFFNQVNSLKRNERYEQISLDVYSGFKKQISLNEVENDKKFRRFFNMLSDLILIETYNKKMEKYLFYPEYEQISLDDLKKQKVKKLTRATR